MITFKKILSLLLAAALLFTLASCHGAREPKDAFTVPESFDAEASYEITFWAKNDTNQTQVSIYKKAIADFEALYPNIKINLRLYTDYGRIYSDVITNIATDTTPNVCITYPDHVATYKEGEGVIVPLDELMADERYGLGGTELRFDGVAREELVSKFLDEGKIGGVQYTLPFVRSTEACYVNKTYVERLGFTMPEVLTWDFVWEVSRAAMERKNADGTYAVNGQDTLIPLIYKSTDNMMIQYLYQKGAGYSTDAGRIFMFNDTTEEFLYLLADEVDARTYSTFRRSGYPANYLNAGQCIFAVDSTAGATWMGSNAPLVDIAEENLVSFETAVYPAPQVDEDISLISQGPSICVFNKEDAGEVLASWLFAQFLLTDEVQLSYARTEGYVPVTHSALDSEEYIDYLSREGEDNDFYYDIKLQATKLLLDNIDNTFITPVFNGSASLRNAAGELIERLSRDKRAGKTVDAAYMEALYETVSTQYHLDQIEDGYGDLGPLPSLAVWLIVILSAVWVGVGVWVLVPFLVRVKKRKKT